MNLIIKESIARTSDGWSQEPGCLRRRSSGAGTTSTRRRRAGVALPEFLEPGTLRSAWTALPGGVASRLRLAACGNRTNPSHRPGSMT
jgi:hypothetical protein